MPSKGGKKKPPIPKEELGKGGKGIPRSHHGFLRRGTTKRGGETRSEEAAENAGKHMKQKSKSSLKKKRKDRIPDQSIGAMRPHQHSDKN